MSVLLDSNVILDVATDDPTWAEWSDQQITRYQASGLGVNPVVYAELAVGANSRAEVDELLASLNVQVVEASREALFAAAKAFVLYRRNGGSRTSPLPDFFIGAQAETHGIPLVTRDPARYRTASGQPAAGVFFNGFSGTDARPATAGTFSGAMPVPMRSDLSGVMAFSNLNIVPMDVDGDGPVSYTHLTLPTSDLV